MDRFTKMTLILFGAVLLILAGIGIAVELIPENVVPVNETTPITVYVLAEGYTGNCSSSNLVIENGIIKDCIE